MRLNERDETILASAGVDCDAAHGSVMPPLYLSANYSFEGLRRKRVFDYARTNNPTRQQLATTLAALERGSGAVVTSTGMSAVDLMLSLLPPGALVIAPHDCYGGTWRLFSARQRKETIQLEFVDFGDAVALASALSRDPALVWIETPSNPLMRVTDIASVCRLAHDAGALVAVDNTFLSPVLQKPIELGADFVVHSTTKYLNGHSDVVGGAVVASKQEHADELAWWANCTGVTAAPFDCWLTLRGMRTLGVRIERQQASAGHLARTLDTHALVSRVHYPGLATHSGYAVASRQACGFGAMLSLELTDASLVAPFVEALRLFTLAESLGGIESLVAHPATMTHAAMSVEARAAAGISNGLVRLSVGLEHVEDLWTDLEGALHAAARAVRADAA